MKGWLRRGAGVIDEWLELLLPWMILVLYGIVLPIFCLLLLWLLRATP